MVAGHAVFVGDTWTPEAVADEANWVLEAYQAGQVATMVAHIRAGVAAAAADPLALLVFSGGQTRPAAGPRSEADTYWRVAHTMGWWANETAGGADDAAIATATPDGGAGAATAADAARWRGIPPVARRTVAEEHARDSYENLLFSVCRFAQVTGAYPSRITVVSFGFKQRRFVHLHRRALRFPATAFSFIGIDPGSEGVGSVVTIGGDDSSNEILLGALGLPPDAVSSAAAASAAGAPDGGSGGGGAASAALASARAGEAVTAAAIAADPYACARAGLRAKRAGRNPFVRYHPYPQGCADLAGLFRHCGARVYAGPLPWDPKGRDVEPATAGSGAPAQQRSHFF